MKARKENKVYRISTEEEKQRYLRDGYDIYSDEGELIEYSPQRKISLSQYEAVRKENESLKKANEALTEENGVLKEQNEALQKFGETQQETDVVKDEQNAAGPKAAGSKAGK